MKIRVSRHFFPLLDAIERYLVLCGGAGSGKSEFCGRKVFYRCQKEGNHRWLIMRKVRKTLGESVILVMRRILEENGVKYEYNKTERKIFFQTPLGPCELYFEGMDDPEKIKSIKGITAVWLEEATEFSKDEFLQIDLRLREPGPAYHQIMLSFNPEEACAPWLKEMFFGAVPAESARVDVSTIEHNPILEVREQYIKRLDALKEKDETFWKIYRLGLWAAQRGRIFNWPVEALPKMKFDEVWYGGDYGYSVDPAALVRIYRKARTFWVEEVIYKTGLTNQDLGREMDSEGVDRSSPAYFDSAEPKSNEELRRIGFNVLDSVKGPDSVRASIDYLKACDIRIVQGSVNLVSEAVRYHWREDKTGRAMNEPVKLDDHLIDATRYGIYSHMKLGGLGIEIVDFDIHPE